MERLPPIAKIYEALSAIADDRITIVGNSAKVKSSDYKKEYIVQWNGNVYSSNDNASYWQGYPGYPIIAVLLDRNVISKPDARLIDLLKGINWKALNLQHKNHYDEAVDEVLQRLKNEGDDVDRLQTEIHRIYKDLSTLDVKIKRSRYRPPSS